MSFVCLTCMLQAQPLVRGGKVLAQKAAQSAQTTASGGLLERLEHLYSSGEKAAQEAQIAQKIRVAKEKQLKYALQTPQGEASKRMEHLLQKVVPTQPQALPALGHPFTGQEFAFSRKYQEAMEEFLQLQKFYNSHTLSVKGPVRFSFGEKGPLGDLVQTVLLRLRSLQKIYPDDKPLKQALSYVYFAMGEINPMLKGVYEEPQKRVGRRFQREEFLFDQMWFDQMAFMAWPPRQAALPEKLQVAVVNDDPSVLQQYKLWQQQGLFKGWKFSFFDTAEEAVKAIAANPEYGLLITDLTVTNSSVLESMRRLRATGNTMPVIVCSAYTVDQINAQQLFNQGFDGFISWTNVSSYGPEHLEEGLKKFFFYKDYYKW